MQREKESLRAQLTVQLCVASCGRDKDKYILLHPQKCIITNQNLKRLKQLQAVGKRKLSVFFFMGSGLVEVELALVSLFWGFIKFFLNLFNLLECEQNVE